MRLKKIDSACCSSQCINFFLNKFYILLNFIMRWKQDEYFFFFLFIYLVELFYNIKWILQAPMSLPHPTTLTSIHASLPHFLPSPALASPVGSSSSQPNIAVSNAPCSTLFVANLGQFVSEHELKEIFNRWVSILRD